MAYYVAWRLRISVLISLQTMPRSSTKENAYWPGDFNALMTAHLRLPARLPTFGNALPRLGRFCRAGSSAATRGLRRVPCSHVVKRAVSRWEIVPVNAARFSQSIPEDTGTFRSVSIQHFRPMREDAGGHLTPLSFAEAAATHSATVGLVLSGNNGPHRKDQPKTRSRKEDSSHSWQRDRRNRV